MSSLSRRLLVLALLGVLLAPATAQAAGVAPGFDLSSPSGAPFPTDRYTVPDSTQLTGVRVDLPKPRFAAAAASSSFTVYVPLEGKIDVPAEVDRTKKEIESVKAQSAQAEKQLSNEEFRKRKPELAAEIEGKLRAFRGRLSELESHLRDLGAAP